MQTDIQYHENANYRLIEYMRDKNRDISLTMCGIEQCLPRKKVGPDKRRGYHLHAVIEGRGVLHVEDREMQVHKGQLFLLVPDRTIWYQADAKEPWYYCWTTFDGPKAGEYLINAGFTDGVYVQDCHIDIHRFLTVSQQMVGKPELNYSSELYRGGLALQFLSLAVESFEEQNGRAGSYTQLSVDDYIDYAIRYINSNYARVKIQDVAEYVNLNRTYFTALFRKKMYMSPQEYLMKVRMERACSLLKRTDLPIRIIAGSVGYENPLTFSKVFKQKFGVGPKDYRMGKRTE